MNYTEWKMEDKKRRDDFLKNYFKRLAFYQTKVGVKVFDLDFGSNAYNEYKANPLKNGIYHCTIKKVLETYDIDCFSKVFNSNKLFTVMLKADYVTYEDGTEEKVNIVFPTFIKHTRLPDLVEIFKEIGFASKDYKLDVDYSDEDHWSLKGILNIINEILDEKKCFVKVSTGSINFPQNTNNFETIEGMCRDIVEAEK